MNFVKNLKLRQNEKPSQNLNSERVLFESLSLMTNVDFILKPAPRLERIPM